MPLEVKNISFRYGKGPCILKKVDLTIKEGEVTGLWGPSGCGKTTLARIMSGYEKPQEGRVELDGNPLPLKGYNPVQMVSQHPEKAVNPRWRLEKTLYEGSTPSTELIKSLGIETEWFRRWPNELSGGELQRFCVARALGPETRFLIADEMTTMLDSVTQAQIWQVVLDMVKKHKMGVLVISHESNLLKRLCSKVVSL